MISIPDKEASRARRRRRRQRWLDVHLYLALAVGLLFVVMGLTGSMNAFFWELDARLNPRIGLVEAGGQRQSLDALMAAVHGANPGRTGSWTLWLPRHERATLIAEYSKPEEKAGAFFAPLLVSVNPYTGEILAKRFWGETLMTFVYEIHADLWLGATGSRAIGVLGLLLLVSLGSGVYLWWPSPGHWQSALTMKRKAGTGRRVFDLHKLGGIYFLPVLAVLALTGCWFVYGKALMPPIRELIPLREPPQDLVSTPLPEAPALSIARAVAIAERIFPEGRLTHVLTPEGPTGVFQVWLRQPGEANLSQPASRVWIDQYSGRILYVQDPNRYTAAETFFNLIWPLHNGEALGLPGRILVCFTGFVPLLLYITGTIRWLQKRKAGKARAPYPGGTTGRLAGGAAWNPYLPFKTRFDK